MAFGFGGSGFRARREAPYVTTLRLGLTLAGLILFGYGVHAEVEWLRWMGIALFVIVVVLRFWPHGPPPNADDRSDD